MSKPLLPDQFKKLIKKVEYYMYIMRQAACLVVNKSQFIAGLVSF